MKKKILITLFSILGVLIIGGGGYAYYLYHTVQNAANKMYEPVDQDQKAAPTPIKRNVVKPITVLLMGVDERKNDRGRSDTLIVMTINPKNKTTQMISIPRDTRTEIVGHGTVDKINHAYAFGRTKMAVDTVENFLNINIDYYVKINMEGLSALVDSVGGVDVYNNISWKDEGYYQKGYDYHKGNLHLNGAQAIGYVRMRHLDPRGDFGRNERQRDVIKGVVDKTANFSSFSKVDDILAALGDNVKTNLSFNDMKYVATHYKAAKDNIVSYEVKGKGTMINKIYYLVVGNEEKQKVTKMIEDQVNS